MKTRNLITAIAVCISASGAVQAAVLDAGETQHLTFMREEEKLARDVYLTFATIYPSAPTFSTIANNSEQTHTDAVRDLLIKYGVADPNPGTNNLPASIGVFTGADYGWYFREKYSALVGKGRLGLLDALYVGAFIEELDMLDIVNCPKVIVDSSPLIGPGGCGLAYTDEKAIKNVYNNLLDGSKNHLRSYVKSIEVIIGAGKYVAQVLTQREVNTILGR
jgi:hypothetical protein